MSWSLRISRALDLFLMHLFIVRDINEVILSGGRRCQHRLALVWHSVIWGLWKSQNDVIFSLEVDFG
jgi:hypothetical protein